MVDFESLELSREMNSSIQELGFTEATQIQERSIPLILEGKDVIGESATGSGKTLAFGTGIVENAEPGKGVQGLVITPTRELAEQVMDYIKALGKPKGLKAASIYGGVAMDPQEHALKNADIIITTPGRFKDHMQRGNVDFSALNTLVLDEADRMLDMGFIEDIEFIIKACPKERQTLMFSATIPPKMEYLAQKYMDNPEIVLTDSQVDPERLEQIYYDVIPQLKISLLVHLIKQETSKLVMIFCNTRRATDLIVSSLKANGIEAVGLHGGFTQNKRNNAMEIFRNGKENVLVCTDVAARGIHVDGISHIYNYEIPNDPKDYVHRIGRTARAGEEGKVVNLLSPEDHDNFARILNEYRSFNVKNVKTPYVPKATVKQPPRDDRRGPRGNPRGRRDNSRKPRDGGHRGHRKDSSGRNRR